MALEHLEGTKETQTATELLGDIRKALKEKGGEAFKDITDGITFDATKLAPGVIVEVKATYDHESTYIYIRENYDVASIKTELKKHQADATAVQIAYVGEGELPISNKDVLENLGEAMKKLSPTIITPAALEQMSFSGDGKLTPGGTAVTVTVTYPGNTLKDGGYPKETTDIRVKELSK